MMLRAFYAFEFWKNAGRDRSYWWSEFVDRRAQAMGFPVGFRKFR
jgi:hypothetical protein